MVTQSLNTQGTLGGAQCHDDVNKPRSIKAVILVGGFGIKMRPLTTDKPKSALHFINKPILFHQIEALLHVGCNHIILAMTVKPPANLDADMKAWL